MFILLLVLLPSPDSAASAVAEDLNCRDACEHCDDAAEDPPLRDVYCSMCDECLLQVREKQERRDMLQNREKQERRNTLQNREKQERRDLLQNREKQEKPDMRMQEYGWYPNEEGYYPECPTAPPCSEETEELKNEEVTATVPYMPPCLPLCPTLPRPTCPPIIPIPCKRRKPKPTRKPQPRPPCIPWFYPYQGQDAEKFKDTDQLTTKDFVYLYVGIPKGVMT